MNNVKFDTENMRTTSKELHSLISDFESQTDEFKQIIENINDAWKGKDAIKYINSMYSGIIKDYIELASILKKYADYINNASMVYDLFDDTFKKVELEKEKVGEKYGY